MLKPSKKRNYYDLLNFKFPFLVLDDEMMDYFSKLGRIDARDKYRSDENCLIFSLYNKIDNDLLIKIYSAYKDNYFFELSEKQKELQIFSKDTICEAVIKINIFNMYREKHIKKLF